ncbi:lipoprotein-anchoring transpeptidase ErfK/SrfK [Aliiruegeria haliotis]|uniref:Lipoprotein-anchoring transpeptidase ErfK/SrfK n=1 Tax=Aliiruegeria haliotis TaxID=1280846 RepID=A0A2T0RI77_9RHOB|nr:L,D-transpeptidase [Aliiruegeria haliotis]PRY20914.1 lipoprotein-anchoring transpeptidase ErfK/SrfK [Aliiruegeria haliotis]
MTSRRAFIATFAATLCAPAISRAQVQKTYKLDKKYQAKVVKLRPGYTPGDIHIETKRHLLYLMLPDDQAIRYGVAVGEEGRNMSGEAYIGRKAEWPSWTPTANMIRREPELYGPMAGGMPGGPDNPLGARALYLYRNGKDTRYRIHGTPQPWTIGRSVSSGCIRMLNDHVIDLYQRVPIGARVIIYT